MTTTIKNFNVSPQDLPIFPQTMPTLVQQVANITEAIEAQADYPPSMNMLEEEITTLLAVGHCATLHATVAPSSQSQVAAANMVQSYCDGVVEAYHHLIQQAYHAGLRDGLALTISMAVSPDAQTKNPST